MDIVRRAACTNLLRAAALAALLTGAPLVRAQETDSIPAIIPRHVASRPALQTGHSWPEIEGIGEGFNRETAGVDLSGFRSNSSMLSADSSTCTDRPQPRFRDDAIGFLPLLRDDACGIVNGNNAAILGGALATAIAFRQDLDGQVRRNTARHPERWGEGTKTLGRMGEVQYHVPVLLALYGYSLKREDDELYSFSKSLISAYTINGLSTMAIKGIANTRRPSDEWNGGQFGFPSFHASSSFTVAAVVDEYYGHQAGLPAYALAGLISWSRVDERDHDLSDVIFGAAMGYVIGHAVAGRHLRCDSRVRLLPWFDPAAASSGLMVDLSF